MNLEFIAQYSGQAMQFMLILVLFWVAFIFMRVDKKLNQMRKGTDGIQATIIELNRAVDNARMALTDLKIGSAEQITELSEKITEAQKLAEGMKFLNSVQKNLRPLQNNHNPNGVEPRGMPPLENDYQNQEFVNREPVKSYNDQRYDNSYDETGSNGDRPQYARRRRTDFSDLPPVDNNRRNQWGGLR